MGSEGPVGPAVGRAASPATRTPATRTPAPGRGRVSEREAWAVLTSVSGLGPIGFGALVGRYGSGGAILEAALTPTGARELVGASVVDGRATFGSAVAAEIAGVARDPGAVLARIRDAGLGILTLDDGDYPARLRAIELPPHVLFVRGDPAALSQRAAIAVVGTRRATEAGRRVAARIAAAIVRTGAAVVSGLAVGIDGAAHAAAVAEHGLTVAVLGSGHGRLFPRAHAGLARRIVEEGGAIVSELPPDAIPTVGTFPRRNRVISGLSNATVVVEAGERSGALITAGWALEQGRDCFLVPGPIDAPRSAGCLAWLREYPDQARIVAGIPELIEDLGLLGGADRDRPETARPARPSLEAELIELGAGAQRVARELVGGRSTLDELVAATGFPVATTLGALTLLELRGLATTTYGRYRPAGRLAASEPGPATATTRPHVAGRAG